MADGRAAALGVCFSALLTTDFEPGLEAMVEGRATEEGLHFVHLWAWRGGGGGEGAGDAGAAEKVKEGKPVPPVFCFLFFYIAFLFQV